MSEKFDESLPERGDTPVPDLIERYRMRRDAWIAQADELARLRDEVRGSAEREAMEIVTAARRDVRKVIMEARRELLVLSAQVQAALGEATAKIDPGALLRESEDRPQSALGPSTDLTSAPESAVAEILNEVRADMTALAEDARALPLQAVPPVQSARSRIFQPLMTSTPLEAPLAEESPREETSFEETSLPDLSIPAAAPFTPSLTAQPMSSHDHDDDPALRASSSPTLLSSPFLSEPVPVATTRVPRTFIAAAGVVALVIVGLAVWWMRTPQAATGSAVSPIAAADAAAPVATSPSPAPDAPAAEPTGPRIAIPPANLSLVAEATREVWVRTTIDGRADQGRMLAAGQVIDVSAQDSISLRVGDAGAVLVSVNRGEKRPLGRDGQALTRQFVVERNSGSKPTPSSLRTPAAGAVEPVIAEPSTAASSARPPVAAPLDPFPAAVPAAAPTPAPIPVPSTPVPSTAQAATPFPPPVSAPPVAPPAAQAAAPLAPPAPQPTGQPTSVQAVVTAAQQWLDAYLRQDRSVMSQLSADNLQLADERRPEERFPPGSNDVTRTLDRVSVQIAADTAVLTAVMTEQQSGTSAARVSPVSQVWVLAGGSQWKVRQARFVSEARLNQVFR